MPVERIYTHNMRNNAHFQYFTDFRERVIEFGATRLKVKPLFDKFEACYAHEDLALKYINGSPKTKKIHDLDKGRNAILYAMRDAYRSALRHHDPLVQEPAERLANVFSSYGNIANNRMHEKTSAIYNFAQELLTNYAAEIAAMNFGHWLTELEARNNAFKALVKDRYDEYAAKPKISMDSARSAVNAIYLAIIGCVNSNIALEGEEEYEPFVSAVNELTRNHAILNARPRRQKKKPSEPAK